MNLATNIIVDEQGAEIVALARQEQTPPPQRRRPVLKASYEDIAKIRVHPVLAFKAVSDTVLASVTPDDPEFETVGREFVAGLVGIAPETPIEAMLATQMIGMHNAVADSLRMAGESCEPLRSVHLDHGCWPVLFPSASRPRTRRSARSTSRCAIWWRRPSAGRPTSCARAAPISTKAPDCCSRRRP